jgi:CheY-like chemotaxis protein
VDPDLASARALSEAFTRADFGFGGARPAAGPGRAPLDSGGRGAGGGNLDTPLVSQLLGTLAHDATLSRVPVVVLGDQALEAPFVSQMRTGVVEILLRPFHPFQHPDRVRQVLAELPERSGRVVGFEALRMVEHIQRTFRSGALKLNPGTPGESQALFTHGVVRGARHREARGEVALAAMLALPRAPWAFLQLSGQEEGPGSPSTWTGPAMPPPSMEEAGTTSSRRALRRCSSPRERPIETEAEAEGEQLLVFEGNTPTPAPPPSPSSWWTTTRSCGVVRAVPPQGLRRHRRRRRAGRHEAAISGGFELLIADLNMPKMDGWACSASFATTTGRASCRSRC